MGLFGQTMGSAVEKLTKDKEQREREKAYVRNNEGSKAICAYMAHLFQKGNAGYDWVKENRVGLFPVIHDSYVSLCYMQPGDGQSLAGIRPKDIEVAKYTFQEMYRWYGLGEGVGYAGLSTRTEMDELESMINSEVQKLPHIKYNNGYLVKMFQ